MAATGNSLFQIDRFLKIFFPEKELPVVAMFVNELGRNNQSL
jgi:hypothetical protein